MSDWLDHLRASDNRYIHALTRDANTREVELALRKAAGESGFHLGVLTGAAILDKDSLVSSLARQYNFPNESLPNSHWNWDNIRDWITDLTWLSEPSDATVGAKGFILLYLDPSVLFSLYPVELAIFISVMDDAAEQLRSRGLPFHLVLGPLEHNVLAFLDLLKSGDHLCPILHVQ